MTHRRMVGLAALAGAVLVAGAVSGFALAGSAGRSAPPRHAALASSSCTGPTGAAYVADPGYQGFTAVDTANCDVVQTYNVDDLPVPGDPTDYNYDGSDAGIALSGTTLWFAVTGTDNVASINTTTLDPSDYNPSETVIPVGFMPTNLAVTPDGSQVWVADSGPQTSTSSLWDIAVIDTATNTVVSTLDVGGDPTDVVFSPDGSTAYVTAANGLYVFDVSSQKQVDFVPGLGSPMSVAVTPDGSYLYVTETDTGKLAEISASTDQVVQTITVGQEPWQVVVSPDGSTVYVANPDSDSVSVVDSATGDVARTLSVPGAPDTLGVTPDGTQLWVAGNDSGIVTVFDTATGDTVGQTNLGGDGANSGDGMAPTGIVLTSIPTPAS